MIGHGTKLTMTGGRTAVRARPSTGCTIDSHPSSSTDTAIFEFDLIWRDWLIRPGRACAEEILPRCCAAA
jgi:hypothetical protein